MINQYIHFTSAWICFRKDLRFCCIEGKSAKTPKSISFPSVLTWTLQTNMCVWKIYLFLPIFQGFVVLVLGTALYPCIFPGIIPIVQKLNWSKEILKWLWESLNPENLLSFFFLFFKNILCNSETSIGRCRQVLHIHPICDFQKCLRFSFI